jgi:uncharacterized protein YuzE
MVIEEVADTTVRIWFDALPEESESIDGDIVIDYDAMGRIVGGELLNLGDVTTPVRGAVGIAKFELDAGVCSFWLLDAPASVRQEVLRGKVLLAGSVVIGIEVPASDEVRAATLQLYRACRRQT